MAGNSMKNKLRDSLTAKTEFRGVKAEKILKVQKELN